MSVESGDGDPEGLLLRSGGEEDFVSDGNGIAYEGDKTFDDGNGGTETAVDRSGNQDADFDSIIGRMEDMLIDDEFHDLQLTYLEKYWEVFVDSEENKHEYMTIFMEYTNEIEAFIQKYIQKLIPSFNMEAFITELEKRRYSLDGEVFEVLFTLTDFNVFKEMFLDYRLMKQGETVDVGQSLYVSPIQ